MATPKTDNSWFISSMVKATTDMWNKGWDERNGGNVSMRLLEADVAPYLPSWHVSQTLALPDPLPDLAGQYFLATGSGKFFRNVQAAPEANLAIFRILEGGVALEVLWGLCDGGVPTSELPAHLKSHLARQRLPGNDHRVIMHCHATNLIALTYVLEFNTANITRALWEGSTECLVVFPEGVAALPWMVPGTDEIGDATAMLMAHQPLVLWQFHGVFGTGRTLDEAFGLIDTAEKSASILQKIIAMGGVQQTITTRNLIDLARRFEVTPLRAAIECNGWRVAGAVAPVHAKGIGR